MGYAEIPDLFRVLNMISMKMRNIMFNMRIIILNNLICEITSFISARNPYKALYFI